MHTRVCGCLVYCTSLHGLNNRDKYHIRKYTLYNCDTVAVTVKLCSHYIQMHGLHYGTRMYWKNVSLHFVRAVYLPSRQSSHCQHQSPGGATIQTNYNRSLSKSEDQPLESLDFVGPIAGSHDLQECITL